MPRGCPGPHLSLNQVSGERPLSRKAELPLPHTEGQEGNSPVLGSAGTLT